MTEKILWDMSRQRNIQSAEEMSCLVMRRCRGDLYNCKGEKDLCKGYLLNSCNCFHLRKDQALWGEGAAGHRSRVLQYSV